MNSEHVTVVYKWTAKPGKLDELTSIYGEVAAAMEQNEPGAEAVHCYEIGIPWHPDQKASELAIADQGKARVVTAPLGGGDFGYELQIGPEYDQETALARLARLREAGYLNARIVSAAL